MASQTSGVAAVFCGSITFAGPGCQTRGGSDLTIHPTEHIHGLYRSLDDFTLDMVRQSRMVVDEHL